MLSLLPSIGDGVLSASAVQVVAAANDNPYGLASGVLAKDQHVIDALVRKLRAGTVWVNTYNVYDAGRKGRIGG
jgi:acyl-CoA reductase-like NAD-dependent aldehyde dehydrogenase